MIEEANIKIAKLKGMYSDFINSLCSEKLENGNSAQSVFGRLPEISRRSMKLLIFPLCLFSVANCSRLR